VKDTFLVEPREEEKKEGKKEEPVMILKRQALSHNIRHADDEIKDWMFGFIRETMGIS